MGTETRIGIVTGLLIVVIASVYFFYGSSSEKDDFLVATGSKIADPAKNGQPLKIPVGGDKNKSTAPATVSKTPAKPTPTPNKPMSPVDKGPAVAVKPSAPGTTPVPTPIVTGEPPTRQVARPTMPPAAAPGTGSAVVANRPPPDPIAGPQPAGIEPRRTEPTVTPIARAEPRLPGAGVGGSSADKTTAGSKRPGESDATEPPKTTALRTGAAKELLDATRENIDKVVKSTATSAPAAGSSSEVARRTGSPPAGSPTGESRTSKPESPATLAERKESKENKDSKDAKDTKAASPVTESHVAAAPAASSVSGWPKQHKIASGETFTTLAQHYYGDGACASQIVEANPQINPRRLKIGDTVVIPAPKETASTVAKSEPKTSSGTAEKAQPGKPTEVVKTAASEKLSTESATKTYQVRDGDTFYSIAKALYGKGARWTEIYEVNRATLNNDPKHLKPGMVLKLPPS